MIFHTLLTIYFRYIYVADTFSSKTVKTLITFSCSLVELLGDFKPLMHDSYMINVTSDLQVIIRGLTSLKAIRNFIPRTGNTLLLKKKKQPVLGHMLVDHMNSY